MAVITRDPGYWGNYDTGEIFEITEHETWLRQGDNAKKLGISDSMIDQFKNFVPQTDRLRFLIQLIAKFPIMRARKHGTFATFEFSDPEVEKPLKLVGELAEKMGLGEYSDLVIIDFFNRREIAVKYHEFKEKMASGVDSVKQLAESITLPKCGMNLDDIFPNRKSEYRSPLLEALMNDPHYRS